MSSSTRDKLGRGRPKKHAGTEGEVYKTTDEENTLVANMTSILNMLIRDGAHAKRSKLSDAIKALNDYIAYANPRYKELDDDGGDTARGLKSKLGKAVKKAHETFANELKDIKEYLEGIGFTNLEGQLYTESDIEAIVKPINERGS